jgi:hypothetical protein
MCALKLISTQNNPPPIVLYNSNKMKNYFNKDIDWVIGAPAFAT